MNNVTGSLIAAVAALTLSGGAYAQANNTLATPTTKSPAAATSGYGTPGVVNSDSGAPSQTSVQPNNANASPVPDTAAYGINNTLARPTTKSPAGQSQ